MKLIVRDAVAVLTTVNNAKKYVKGYKWTKQLLTLSEALNEALKEFNKWYLENSEIDEKTKDRKVKKDKVEEFNKKLMEEVEIKDVDVEWDVFTEVPATVLEILIAVFDRK